MVLYKYVCGAFVSLDFFEQRTACNPPPQRDKTVIIFTRPSSSICLCQTKKKIDEKGICVRTRVSVRV